MIMRAVLLCLLLPPAAVAAECLPVDPSQSEVRFEVLQAGAPFSDTFEKLGGEVCVEGDAVSRIDTWIDPASLETGMPELDAALAGNEFFAVDAHPRVTFTSNAIEASADGFLAHGTLEMKGVAKPVDITFRVDRAGDAYVASGETTVRRLDFNIGTGEWSDTQWLGDDVTVTFRIHTK